SWNLGHLVGYVAGVSISLSLPFIAIAFSINPLVETAWPGEQRLKVKGRKSKWSRIKDKVFGFLVASGLYKLPYFKRLKDNSSYYSPSYSSSGGEYYSRTIARNRRFPRRLLLKLESIFAALWNLCRRAAVKIRIISAP